MKICQITPYYLPHTGGIERYVYNLSQYLISTKNHTIDVLTANIPESAENETVDTIRIHRYPCRFSPMGNPILSNLSDLPSRLNEYDIIHIHGVYTYLALKTILALRKKSSRKTNERKPKIYLTHHGRVVYPKSPKNIIAKIYENIFVRLILKEIDTAVVLSKSDKEQFISLGMPEEKIIIIPNGIDRKVFVRPDEETLQKFRTAYALSNKKIVLYLAVISRRKGIFDLLHAFKQLNDKDTTLLVVGDGPDKEKAVALAEKLGIKEQVVFTGKLSFENLLCAYSAADVYTLPSYFEGMPTTILESLTLETPVISTKIPGVADNFEGVIQLVTAGDIAELSTKISEVLSGKCMNKIEITDEFMMQYDITSSFKKYDELYSDKGVE